MDRRLRPGPDPYECRRVGIHQRPPDTRNIRPRGIQTSTTRWRPLHPLASCVGRSLRSRWGTSAFSAVQCGQAASTVSVLPVDGRASRPWREPSERADTNVTTALCLDATILGRTAAADRSIAAVAAAGTSYVPRTSSSIGSPIAAASCRSAPLLLRLQAPLLRASTRLRRSARR